MRTRSIVTAAALTFVTVLGGAGAAIADGPDAVGTTGNSPGVLSGNNVQVPVDLGLNLCGNTVDVLGLLNPATGNECQNHG